MSAEAAAYPKLLKIYKELKRQNQIIFEAEKERNAWELERDNLKGIARFTKKANCKAKSIARMRRLISEWEKTYGEKTAPKTETFDERL